MILKCESDLGVCDMAVSEFQTRWFELKLDQYVSFYLSICVSISLKMYKHFRNICFYVIPRDNYYCIYRPFSYFLSLTALLIYGNMREVGGEMKFIFCYRVERSFGEIWLVGRVNSFLYIHLMHYIHHVFIQ